MFIMIDSYKIYKNFCIFKVIWQFWQGIYGMLRSKFMGWIFINKQYDRIRLGVLCKYGKLVLFGILEIEILLIYYDIYRFQSKNKFSFLVFFKGIFF